MDELDLWGKPIPECQKSNRVPYVQCDCPVHDFVAELLGIRSTRKEGYDPHKPVSLGWAAEHAEKTEQIVLKALEEEAALKYLLPSTVKGADGSRGPDGYRPYTTGSTGPSQYVRGATGPGLVPKSGATGPAPLGYYRGEPIYTERDEYDGLDYVYEFGNPNRYPYK